MGLLDIEEKYEIGYKIFEQLFKLSDKELKEKLQSIIGSNLHTLGCDDILTATSGVKRIIQDEKYDEITICSYDYITISAFGIWFNPEHGEAKKLIEFNKHFSL